MNKIQQAQAIVREGTPVYLRDNPPVGAMQVLAHITRRLTPHEFRKAFVRMPDDLDEKEECPMCKGDGDCWITEEQAVVECPYCSGEGYLPFNYNQVFIIVYRDHKSVEALVTVAVNGDCHAVVTVAEQGFKKGQKIELTANECQLVKEALEKKETV